MDYQPWSADMERDLAREIQRKMEAEQRRLQEVNAELLAALDGLTIQCEEMPYMDDSMLAAMRNAYAAIARARGVSA